MRKLRIAWNALDRSGKFRVVFFCVVFLLSLTACGFTEKGIQLYGLLALAVTIAVLLMFFLQSFVTFIEFLSTIFTE